MIIKLVIATLFILAVISLGIGFVNLLKGPKYANKLLLSLKFRISLSVLAIVIIAIAWFSGTIVPQVPWIYTSST